jgi:hypothetical protein
MRKTCPDADRPITPRERLGLAVALCALALTALLAGACSAPACAAPSPAEGHPGPLASVVYLRQAAVIDAMREFYPGVEIDVVWKPCGEENSYYYGGAHRIELCTEMEAHPDAALFFAAHEAGHAVTQQLAGTLDEGAADAVGALAMIRLNLRNELLGAAAYHGSQDLQAHYPGDPHPSNGYRAWFLKCLEMGSGEGALGPPECHTLYEGTKTYWERRLTDDQYKAGLILDWSNFFPGSTS